MAIATRNPDYDPDTGLALKDMNDFCIKYFGREPEKKERRMFRLDDETGRLISSAWGYEPDQRFVLVKKEQRSEEKLLLTFACHSAYSDLSPKVYREALLSCHTEEIERCGTMEMLVTDKTDENGEFYIQYHAIRQVDEA